MIPALLFRADASATLGTGHVMRCLALAQAWRQAGGRAVFLQAATTPALTRRLEEAGCASEPLAAEPGGADDAAATIRQAHACGASWVVGDGYHFDAVWQRQVRAAGLRLLLLDDYGHAGHYHADLVLNQNLSADAALYTRRDPATRLLLGPRYALLRREFTAAARPARDCSALARKVLVTLGGSDPDNVTAKVVAALRGLPALETVVVAGGSNPNLAMLRTVVDTESPALRLVVDAPDMPELMAWADVAITAGGSTVWEAAWCGLPSLVLVLADNQEATAEGLHAAGVAVRLGRPGRIDAGGIAAALATLLPDCEHRSRMSELGRRMVDGRGAGRVCTLVEAERLTIRRARPEDCGLIWGWANDPAVRASAFQGEQIPWHQHQQWFDRTLRNPASVIFVGLDAEGDPFGQVRFDWDEQGIAEVDVSVDRERRNAGRGSALIRRAVDELFATAPVRSVCAHIKPETTASLHAFAKAGFDCAGRDALHGRQAVCMRIVKSPAGHAGHSVHDSPPSPTP